MDTGTTIVILAVGAGITLAIIGAITLFGLGRWISWMWRR